MNSQVLDLLDKERVRKEEAYSDECSRVKRLRAICDLGLVPKPKRRWMYFSWFMRCPECLGRLRTKEIPSFMLSWYNYRTCRNCDYEYADWDCGD